MNDTQDTRKEQVPADKKRRMPSSRVLEEVIDQAPADYFTVGWLTSILQQRSFGIVMLFLGLLATIPVGSTVPGVMLAAMAVQLIGGRSEPIFPHFITRRRLPTRHLLRLGGRAIHVLKYLEKAIHPRWPMTFEVAKRAVGVMVLLLTAVLLLTPVPFSNVAPAMVISLISLAYVEEDGCSRLTTRNDSAVDTAIRLANDSGKEGKPGAVLFQKSKSKFEKIWRRNPPDRGERGDVLSVAPGVWRAEVRAGEAPEGP
jgi:hypothetical protein